MRYRSNHERTIYPDRLTEASLRKAEKMNGKKKEREFRKSERGENERKIKN